MNLTNTGRKQIKAFSITCCERSQESDFAKFMDWYQTIFGPFRTSKVKETIETNGIQLGGKIDLISDQRNTYATLYKTGFNGNNLTKSGNNVEITTLNEFIIKYNGGGGPMYNWLIVYK